MFDSHTLQPYFEILPYALTAFVASLLITPLVGRFARKYNFMDLPANMRLRTDQSINQRIHEIAKPRLGALAALIPLLIIFFTLDTLTTAKSGILLGLLVLMISGAIDDKFELSSKKQFLFHFVAAFLVVLTGTTITSVTIAGITLDFNSFSRIIDLGFLQYRFIFPADLITIFWIMTIINSVNWVCGIDALGEMLTVVAATTIMFLSVKFQHFDIALLSGVLAAAILGYVPYNFPPSKIIGGTAGHTSFGFLLATFSMFSGAKISTAIILLFLPLLDMFWVIIYRLYKYREVTFLKRPFVSGRVHLHHRLMDMGYSQKQVLIIETSGMAIISLIAFYFGGFSDLTLIILGVLTTLIVIFTLISIRSRNLNSQKLVVIPNESDDDTPKPPKIKTDDDDDTPEEKFAY